LLEDRWCPAHLTLNATVLPGHEVQLSGTVTGSTTVAGYNIMFMGAVGGMATSDSNGNFSYLTSQASIGAVTASGMDMQGDTTDMAQASVAVAPPQVTGLTVTYGAGNSVTISGTVTSMDPAGRNVMIGGVAMGFTTTDSAGNFSVTTNAWCLGEIDVTGTDAWGQTSNTATAQVAVAAPIITDFYAEQVNGNTWIFEGEVQDPSPQNLTIRLGGLLALTGQSVQVNADGSFAFTTTLPLGECGLATATAVDAWGQLSATVNCSVT
jgi:hypothetical protein